MVRPCVTAGWGMYLCKSSCIDEYTVQSSSFNLFIREFQHWRNQGKIMCNSHEESSVNKVQLIRLNDSTSKTLTQPDIGSGLV